MKTTPLAIITIFSFFIRLPSVLGQGSLTPPGAPGPTMLTLSQIEPRTPISSAPFMIAQPGSYYLTTNLTVNSGNAITIATSGVTLDLNGFTISSTAGSAAGYGILLVNGPQNLTIANGHIQGGVTNNGSGVYSGGGFAFGIEYTGANPANVLVSRVSVSGCLDDGIFPGYGASTVVESCTVQTVGSYGIVASTVKASTARDCGVDGIFGDALSDCQGQASVYGIYAAFAENCYGASSSGNGVYAANTAMNCSGTSGSNGYGLEAGTAENCYGSSSSGNGVSATTAENCYGSSSGGDGVNAANTALNCYGTSDSHYGVFAITAQNCYGSSSNGNGVNASTAENCYGTSSSGTGVYATSSVLNCFGYSVSGGVGVDGGYSASGCFGYSPSGTGLKAFIGNACHGATTVGTALILAHNVNSF
jgi:hypothetical protein